MGERAREKEEYTTAELPNRRLFFVHMLLGLREHGNYKPVEKGRKGWGGGGYHGVGGKGVPEGCNFGGRAPKSSYLLWSAGRRP